MLNWWSLGNLHKEDPAIGWTLITFAVFIFLIRYLTKKPLAHFLENRAQSIKTAIEEAALAKEDAEKKLQQYEQRLLELDGEIKKMKSDFEKQGELERERLKIEAQKVAEEILKDSEQNLKAETARVLLKLKQEIAEKILLEAQKNIHLTPELNQKLCRTFVEQTTQGHV